MVPPKAGSARRIAVGRSGDKQIDFGGQGAEQDIRVLRRAVGVLLKMIKLWSGKVESKTRT
jgi:hypothetical protein